MGYGNPSLIQTILSTPLCHTIVVVSNVPAGVDTLAFPLGAIGDPPIDAILPQYCAVSD